ncbi:MAG: hypothetical protein ACLQQ4_17130 [Bacteroidia bacterium]
MKTEKSEKPESNQTKTITFRLPADVFDTLHEKGQAIGLSAHEFAGKEIQENHQVSHEAIPMKDTVTHSKQIFLPPPSKQVFHFNRKELKSVYYALTGRDCLPCHIDTIRIGIDEVRGVTKIGEDKWEVVVEHSYSQFKKEEDTWKY